MAETEEKAEPASAKEIAPEIAKEAEADAAAVVSETSAGVRAEPIESPDVQRLGEEAFAPAAPAAFSVFENIGAIVGEAGDYSRRSLENGATFLQKLIGAASLESVLQIQSEYARISCLGFITHVMKLGRLYSNFARLALKPLEGSLPKAPTAKS